jgi:hypothetical protein
MPNKVPWSLTSPSPQVSKKTFPPIGAGTVTSAIWRELWLSVKLVMQLKQPMRQIDDPFYTSILESMRWDAFDLGLSFHSNRKR